jgi:hypothetical protein
MRNIFGSLNAGSAYGFSNFFYGVGSSGIYAVGALTIISIQEHFLRKVFIILSMVQIPVLYMAYIMKYIIQEPELNKVF